MLAQSRNLAAQIALVLAGVAAGALAAWLPALTLQQRAADAELARYARNLEQNGNNLAAEVRTTLDGVRADNLPFCSDQELARLRAIVYNSAHIKDIGRNRNGHLECTAGMGRLASPPALHAAPIVIRGMNIFLDLPLLISPSTTGFIVEDRSVSVVLNPDDYSALDQPPMMSSGLIYDRWGGRVFRVFGHREPLSSADIFAQRLIERGGMVYMPLCSAAHIVCIVAAEPRSSMTAIDRAHFVGFLICGGLLGGSCAFSAILFFSRQRNFQRSLRRAIRRGEVTVAYQPIVELATGSIVGAEALARWTNDAGEPVSPEIFVAVAEQKGFIHELTQLMIQRATAEIAELLRRENFRLTINITARDLRDPEFFSGLGDCLKRTGISPGALGFELTERSTAEQSLVAEALARLKAAGHAVYVDDFGTGYSSLAYLHRLDIDAIKIDRAFTSTVGTEAVTASVVPQILDMAHRLNLGVVVEGIETKAQAEHFGRNREGILGQGWLFGKPVPAADFKHLFYAHQQEGEVIRG